MTISYTTTDPTAGTGVTGSVGSLLYYVTGGFATLMTKYGTGNTNWASLTAAAPGTFTTVDPRSAGLAGVIGSQILYVTGGVSTLLVKYGSGATDWAQFASPPVTLANTTVIPGSYTSTDLTVGADGRITAATSGTGGGALPLFDTTLTHAFTGGNFATFDDVNFGSLGQNTLVYYTQDGNAQNLRGVAGGVDGITICLIGTTANSMVATNEAAGSTAGNRILVQSGAGSINIPTLGPYWLIYDGSVSRWRQVGYSV